MSNKTSVNILFNVLLTLSQVAFPIITFPYLSRVLLPEGLGAINFIDNILQYLLFIAALGIPVYGMREISKYKNNPKILKEIFSELLTISIISSLIISILYFIVLLIVVPAIAYKGLYYYGCLIIFINVFTIDWLYQGLELFPYITTRNIAVKSIIVLLTFILVKSKENLNVYYILLFSSYLFNGLINILYAYKKLGIYPTLVDIRLKNLKKHIKPILLIFSANLAISIFLYLDSFILGIMKGYTAVGYYTTATKIVKLPAIAIQAIIMVFVPKISFAYKNGNLQEVNKLIQRSFDFVSLLSIPAAIGLFCYADVAIHLFSGDKYKECVLLLRTMSPIIIFLSLTNIFIWGILTPMGKEKYFLVTVGIAMIVSLIINIILIPFISYKGSAVATLVTEFSVMLLSYIYSKKTYSINLSFITFKRSIFASLAFFPIYYFTMLYFPDNLPVVVGSIFLCIFLYLFIYMFLFKSFLPKEIMAVLKSKSNQ